MAVRPGGACWQRWRWRCAWHIHPRRGASGAVFHGIFVENKGHRGHEKPIPSGDVNIAIEIAIYSGFTH